jgi:dihydrofolate synthase / folylpolyglutamate synthase
MQFTRLADWLQWQESLHPQSIDLGLARVQRVLARLGLRPAGHPVITVAGTNGKGSCVALLESLLSCAGYRVGAFTSPHLHRYNERIRVGGVEISDASLVAAFERIEAARQGDTLTFFEFNALAALVIFDTAGIDCAVLEVGLGGRLDAVNVVDADVALITSIGLDHCEWLGTTVEAIGREKAGILRTGRPAIFGSGSMPASVQEAADVLGVPLKRLGRDFGFEVTPSGWTWTQGEVRIEGLPRPALPGPIQVANAASVIAVLQLLAERLPVPRNALDAGLRSVRLAGRFEVRPGTVPWIFDVAHNPDAARVLAENLASLPDTGRTIAVCGILGDKDIEAIGALLKDRVDVWILAGLPGPRATSVQTLQIRFGHAGIAVLASSPDVVGACGIANEIARPGDRVVVFGSFLTVGPAREWHSGLQTPAPSAPPI